MLRPLYGFLLRRHPARFRRRFADEMVWIFDQASTTGGRAALLGDALVSLVRQWALRPENRGTPAVPAAISRSADGAPAFHVFGDSKPRPAALIHGMLLSAALFAAAPFVIVHGGASGLVKLPRVTLPGRDITPGAAAGRAGAHIAATTRPAGSTAVAGQPLERSAEVSKSLGSLQASGGEQGKTLGEGARGLKLIPVPGDPRVNSRQGIEADRAKELFLLLDLDRDGKISYEESSSDRAEPFRELLVRADRDEDGVVTLEELREAVKRNDLR